MAREKVLIDIRIMGRSYYESKIVDYFQAQPDAEKHAEKLQKAYEKELEKNANNS